MLHIQKYYLYRKLKYLFLKIKVYFLTINLLMSKSEIAYQMGYNLPIVN